MYITQYEIEYKGDLKHIDYGCIEKILVCRFPEAAARIFQGLTGRTIMIALLTPCQTAGKDATKELTSYTRKLATIATDLQNIQSVVSQLQTWGEWYIIDHGGEYASPASQDGASDDESD